MEFGQSGQSGESGAHFDGAQAFSNEPINADLLPRLADQTFEQVLPAYLTQQQSIWAALGIVATAAAVTSLSLAGAPVLIIVAIVLVIFAFVAAAIAAERAAFGHRGVLLREHDVSARRGLISRTVATAPFVRVQHVVVTRGALDRIFGLAQLKVFTAGAGFADLTVSGLDPQRADQLREAVLSRSAAWPRLARRSGERSSG